ncbi:hypothetical protein TL18_04410 [Methanobrevibacter sp. YE315]|uniref:hypothetical protein n=1 Tax=Methanobrevibacter sp. YE315 TaxID=1609968 RepID=UPI000764EE11|nr:hypothetical protein [Methanobrevibacter sp. YE315]AMD17332.1 hypothetical protein TL18_04410 [Methanobrevibacter sp. YE315]
MQKKTKIAIVVLLLLVIGGFALYEFTNQIEITYKSCDENDLGSVEKIIYGNESSNHTIALITGIHPRETLSIEPEIKAAKEFVKRNDDVKVIHYQVNVTKDPEDYQNGRANGESLVHDYVNPDVTASDADCVIISHSHIPEYGEGYYLATPEMDNASVKIAKTINKTGEFGYYPVTGNETYKSTSAVLVSKPIAQAGYPTFVYEIPEDITDFEATLKTMKLFELMVRYT